MLSPPRKVVAAMPGTLAELSERTEYPPGEVLRQIENARREGLRVNARMGAKFLGAVGVEFEPTVYERLDRSSEKE